MSTYRSIAELLAVLDSARVEPLRAPLVLDDPRTTSLRALIRIIDSIGGYLTPEDQRALFDARRLVCGE